MSPLEEDMAVIRFRLCFHDFSGVLHGPISISLVEILGFLVRVARNLAKLENIQFSRNRYTASRPWYTRFEP